MSLIFGGEKLKVFDCLVVGVWSVFDEWFVVDEKVLEVVVVFDCDSCYFGIYCVLGVCFVDVVVVCLGKIYVLDEKFLRIFCFVIDGEFE